MDGYNCIIGSRGDIEELKIWTIHRHWWWLDYSEFINIKSRKSKEKSFKNTTLYIYWKPDVNGFAYLFLSDHCLVYDCSVRRCVLGQKKKRYIRVSFVFGTWHFTYVRKVKLCRVNRILLVRCVAFILDSRYIIWSLNYHNIQVNYLYNIFSFCSNL